MTSNGKKSEKKMKKLLNKTENFSSYGN